MKKCSCKKWIWLVLGVVGVLALVLPLVYAVIKVDKIPGLIIHKDSPVAED